ncbi:phosphoribosyltransferase family protein [Dokdonia sp. Hel_I_53]|uniref:phosphoribosyltransferase family protein n=1 Tax=Dokdonia sp. Hel_I_53 TaxID=1566287 RepID=UPI00119AEB21|nr:phosphoribosyltransferase family protein [Dokdonia sp. Hel_I_53]TVZ51921.1 pyrimidine operon attenuation protein/uracil phosphoribosyltransferase [Dokdonia sp. Hel_I_53]
MKIKLEKILDHTAIEHKIRRIAFQIYESNADEKEVVLAGIADNGYKFAERLSQVLIDIAPFKTILCKVTMDKQKPLGTVKTSLLPKEYTNKSIVLIDDVLNSGTTLVYGVKHFLDVPLKRFKTAVLVNRNHKKYPVKADFKGISLSTSLNESVKVIFTKGNDTVVLE